MNDGMNKSVTKRKIFGFLKSKIITNILLVICSVVITVGIIELFTGGLITRKITQIHKQIVSYHKRLTTSPWPIGAYRYNETIGYELTPGFSGMYKRKRLLLKTHHLGYRIAQSEDSDSFKPGGILSLGCSFTFCYEVNAAESFPYLVAKHFNRPSYNYGVCSYSYASAILQLEDLEERGILEKLKPSIAILGCGNWLIQRSLSPFYPTPDLQFGYAYIESKGNQLQIRQPNDFYSTKHLYKLVDRYFNGNDRNVRLTLGRYLKLLLISFRVSKANRDQKSFKIPGIPSRQLYDFVIGRILKILKKYNTKLVILWMPMIEKGIDVGLVKSVNDFDGITLVDGLKALKENNVDPKFYYKTHPRAEAYAVYADALIEAIKEQ